MGNDTHKFSIGMVAEGITIVVAIGFVISVIYDWGFVYAIDIDLMSLPTTISDHFRTGVIWFPYLLAFVLMYFAVEYQFQRVEKGLTEQEIIESSKNPEKLKKFREGPWKLIKWTAPLAVFNYILIGDIMSSALPLMLSILWMGFAEWCYSAPLIKLRRSWESQAAFTFLPIIFILAFFSGYNAAVDASMRKPKQVIITFSQKSPHLKGKLLREFERGVFILNHNDHVTFIPWGQIKSIKTVEKYKPFRGILCEWFQICTETASNKANSADAKSRAGD
ncbi:hypothetical protein SAMN04488516_10212 [Desulfonauticus submarinus]|uniref:Uncharacterized protein n=1 Tax=Desulfonauticus submarinus TaxID=206665 RepID=A0A1H0B3J7_9BACT|nr:hypothetical protein [Desulfonauticus submarinus]SDN39923.1 hypothetical protein SAMN04488516_10212 [Desulfonauticus submarinus]